VQKKLTDVFNKQPVYEIATIGLKNKVNDKEWRQGLRVQRRDQLFQRIVNLGSLLYRPIAYIVLKGSTGKLKYLRTTQKLHINNKPTLLFITMVLLMNATHIEWNPGPSFALSDTFLYLCRTCKEPVLSLGMITVTCVKTVTRGTTQHATSTTLCMNDWIVTYPGRFAYAMNLTSNYSTVLFDLHGIDTKSQNTSIGSLDSNDDSASPKFTSSPVKPRPKPCVSVRPWESWMWIVNLSKT